jgi:hypothetical protein
MIEIKNVAKLYPAKTLKDPTSRKRSEKRGTLEQGGGIAGGDRADFGVAATATGGHSAGRVK